MTGLQYLWERDDIDGLGITLVQNRYARTIDVAWVPQHSDAAPSNGCLGRLGAGLRSLWVSSASTADRAQTYAGTFVKISIEACAVLAMRAGFAAPTVNRADSDARLAH